MVVQIPAGTAAGGIPHVQRAGVRAFRRKHACTVAGHECCRARDARAFSHGQRDQPATARAGAWREPWPRKIARACSGRQRRRAHVCTCRNPTRVLSAGNCTCMFRAAAFPAARSHVHVAGGRPLARKMHELARGGSDSDRNLHETSMAVRRRLRQSHARRRERIHAPSASSGAEPGGHFQMPMSKRAWNSGLAQGLVFEQPGTSKRPPRQRPP